MKGQKEMSTTEVENNNYTGGCGPGCTRITLTVITGFPSPALELAKIPKKNKVLHIGLFVEERGGNEFKIREEGKVCRLRTTSPPLTKKHTNLKGHSSNVS